MGDVAPGYDETVEGSDPRLPPAGLAIGATIGRYRIERRIGAGGMGVVYEAHDRELDRVVALKVLRHPARDDDSHAADRRARLVREAVSLARIAHPHVVSVFDSGELGDDVFVAMELVDGDNLATWLAAERRDWRRIVDVFIDGGRGLAAAHAAGVVHRDFKPSNVIVGRDGRVRVCDFGLARIAAERERREPAERPALVSRLTEADALIGTPMYMPPEHHAGAELDARADQYSFCVSMWEALARGTPFPSCTTLDELVEAQAAQRLRPIADARVPRRLRKALLRGMAIDPDARFPTLDALVGELVAIRRRPRQIAVAAGAGALVAISAGVALALGSRGSSLPSCDASARLDGVWDPPVRAAVGKAFASTAWPGAAATLVQVERRLDDYANRWRAMRVEACEAMRAGDQSAELFDLRASCLERRRGELAALTTVFAHADDGIAMKAIGAILELTPIDGCADAKALRQAIPPPRDPAVRAQIDAIRSNADAAVALRRAGHYADGLVRARAIAIDGVDYAPVRAEALTALADLEDWNDHAAEAEAAYRRAATEAGRADDDHLLANAWVSLIYVVGITESRTDDALALGEFAATLAARAKEPAIEGALHNNLGAVRLRRNELDIAARELAQAIDDRVAAFGEDHPAVASSVANLGNVRARQGDLDGARRLLERALAIHRRTLAPEHPQIAEALENLAFATKDPQAAIELERQAIAIRMKARLGDAAIGAALSNLAGYEYQVGQLAEAERDYRAAIDRLRAALPAKHPNLGAALSGLAEVLVDLHRTAEAIAFGDESLAIATANPGADEVLANAKYSLGIALAESGRDRARGRRLLEEARAAYAATGHRDWEAKARDWLARTASP